MSQNDRLRNTHPSTNLSVDRSSRSQMTPDDRDSNDIYNSNELLNSSTLTQIINQRMARKVLESRPNFEEEFIINRISDMSMEQSLHELPHILPHPSLPQTDLTSISSRISGPFLNQDLRCTHSGEFDPRSRSISREDSFYYDSNSSSYESRTPATPAEDDNDNYNPPSYAYVDPLGSDDELIDDKPPPPIVFATADELAAPDPEFLSKYVEKELVSQIAAEWKKDCRTWLWKNKGQRKIQLAKQNGHSLEN